MSRIAAAETVEALQTTADALAAEIGFGHVTYTLHLPNDPTRIPLLFTSYPQGWVQHYSEHNFFSVDPVIRLARLGRPFGWRDIPDSVRAGTGRHVLSEAREFGVVDGYCVPILGTSSIGAFNATAQGSARERDEALRYGTESLVALGNVVHERARLLTMREAGAIVARLSPVESEMVQRLVTGLNEDQVVAAMRLGDGEFRRLLASVMSKLDTTTPDQLRARTALLGLAEAS
ncbi:autoinducer binding domain-containing protein [Caenispirillum bisanense]|uniref:autoinducer binding domain-containing protein n=1 Tax=Caenispirillum bisanense TaxID=414052 RepID=UPI0031E3DF2A